MDKEVNNTELSHGITEAFKLCIKQNYFQFNNKIYTQKNGLAMGSPLSSLLSEIFLDKIENEFIKNNKFKKLLLYWFRYVDDILICWNGSERQFTQFMQNLNAVHENIKFTVEKENEGTLNFLDLTITRINKKHEFKIFRKPTYTDITIHNNSLHPKSHKLAAYHSMVHRLVSIPMSISDFKNELTTIKEIANNNGFEPQIIDQILYKKKYQQTLNLIYPHQKSITNTKYSILPFYGNISNIMCNEIKKTNTNLKIAFKTTNNIKKTLFNNKDKTQNIKNSGVYELNCDDCGAKYIGQTGRAFDTRIGEHKTAYIKGKTNSTFANHLIEAGHSSNFIPKILHIENKGFKLTLLEALEIQNQIKLKKEVLNEIQEVYKSPLVGL